MKFETQIGGHAGTLSIDADRLHYQREGGDPVACEFSCEQAGEGAYTVLLNGASYQIVLLPAGEVWVNGSTFRAEVFDPRGLRGRRGPDSETGRKSIAALMPGRIVRVLVEAGQTVEAGQGLVVVEAMKMQNEMKAPRAGKVAQVKAQPGTTVAAGEVLLVLE